MARRTPFALASVLAASLAAPLAAGCGGHEAAPPQTAAAKKAEAPAAATVTPAVPAGHLARGDVEAVLRKGPPWLLRRVTMEEVIREGKFVGWRVLSVSLPDGWKVDLQPGDIVTKVNGLGLERPDDFFAAWMQLYSAVELRISGERDGKAWEVVMPISGPTSATSAVAQAEVEPPPPPKRSRWQTVVIEGDAPVPIGDVQE